LAGEFHSYYNAERFLIDEVPRRRARLLLVAAVGGREKRAPVLGIGAPDNDVIRTIHTVESRHGRASPLLERPPAQPRARRDAPRPVGIGARWSGLFIGICGGLGLAAGVAFYLMRAGNPYQPRSAQRARPRDPARPAEVIAAEKPRFDFYKILPVREEPKRAAAAAGRALGRRSRRRGAGAHSPRRRPVRRDAPQAVEKLPEKAAPSPDRGNPPSRRIASGCRPDRSPPRARRKT
jgi:hypothetical protein